MKSFLLLVAIVFLAIFASVAVQFGFSHALLIIIGSIIASIVVVELLDLYYKKIRF